MMQRLGTTWYLLTNSLANWELTNKILPTNLNIVSLSNSVLSAMINLEVKDETESINEVSDILIIYLKVSIASSN